MAVVRRCSVAATVCLVDTDCPGGETCDPTCDCNGGPDSECELAGPVDQKRCVAAMDVPCLIDADCPPFGGACKSMFGPPLPFSAGGAPTCFTSYFDNDFTGTVDHQSGRVELATRLRSRVHIGLELGKPCPTCGAPAQNPAVGDTFTCDGGPQDGETCSVDAVNAIFGGTSFDCPPSVGSNISGSGLAIRLDRISTEPQSVDASLACGGFMAGLHPSSGNAVCLDTATPCATNADCQRCTGAPTIPCATNGDCSGNGTCAAAPEQPVACGVYCHCGFCDGDPSAPCFSDAQCGIGETCEQGIGITRQVQNNRCDDLICGLGGLERCCDASDPDCVLPTPLDGECADQPYRPCTNNNDCTSEGATGPCVLSNRPCFENRIVRTGSASPLASYCLAEPVPSTCTTNADCSVGACTPYVMRPQLDALFCSPPSSGSGVNATYGIPGPAVLSLDVTLLLDGGSACLCGNGVLECLEQCDDANNTNGDGCDQNCSVTACGKASSPRPVNSATTVTSQAATAATPTARRRLVATASLPAVSSATTITSPAATAVMPTARRRLAVTASSPAANNATTAT
jgi:cysteine-rich repeat protein